LTPSAGWSRWDRGCSRTSGARRPDERRLPEPPSHHLRSNLDLEADPGRAHTGYPQQVPHLEPPQPVHPRKGRAPLQRDLGRFLHLALRQPRRHVGKLHGVTLLVLEEGHDPPDTPCGRQVELQAHLDGLSHGVSHASAIISPHIPGRSVTDQQRAGSYFSGADLPSRKGWVRVRREGLYAYVRWNNGS
jgi:hypothetical protein